jgi:hypothetical protein
MTNNTLLPAPLPPLNILNAPIWTAVVFTEQSGDIPTLRPIRLGGGMTKTQAWEAARALMDSRRDVVGMTVRRDGEML